MADSVITNNSVVTVGKVTNQINETSQLKTFHFNARSLKPETIDSMKTILQENDIVGITETRMNREISEKIRRKLDHYDTEETTFYSTISDDKK